MMNEFTERIDRRGEEYQPLIPTPNPNWGLRIAAEIEREVEPTRIERATSSMPWTRSTN